MEESVKIDEKQLIRVFTLNCWYRLYFMFYFIYIPRSTECWGIPYISKDKDNRITAIAEFISSSKFDLVCLQEVWSKRDYLYICKKCYSQFPYSHYFNSFIKGSGLCILSKYPIIDVYFHQWPINGYAHKIHQGDWFAGKGLAFSRIKINGLLIHLYNAHLHAEYNVDNTDYLSHRVLQAFDTSQFIKFTSEDCDVAILAGDLNTEPEDLAMKILIQNAHLIDSFHVAQAKNCCVLGTSESKRNSYAPNSEIKRQPEGKRIDYILFRNSKKLNVEVLQYGFPLPERVPGSSYSYSDHEGVEVVMQCVIDSNLNAKIPEVNPEDLRKTIELAIDICNNSLKKLRNAQKGYLMFTILFAVLIFLSLFAELFFTIPLDFGSNHVASIICFNILKVFFTLAFAFFVVMATLWSRSEKSAVLIGKFSMKTILRRLKES